MINLPARAESAKIPRHVKVQNLMSHSPPSITSTINESLAKKSSTYLKATNSIYTTGAIYRIKFDELQLSKMLSVQVKEEVTISQRWSGNDVAIESRKVLATGVRSRKHFKDKTNKLFPEYTYNRKSL